MILRILTKDWLFNITSSSSSVTLKGILISFLREISSLEVKSRSIRALKSSDLALSLVYFSILFNSSSVSSLLGFTLRLSVALLDL